ncbi:MAG: hypothetical protein ACYDH9_23185 [Limisphaerales bacterium]
MIASFFHALSRHDVRYLLISGQATVLYGAATFSEDIDLWVAPDKANLGRFLAALQAVKACYYKLTPPVTAEWAKGGHGFHFRLPGEEDAFLDVLGCPPRVGPFAEALATAVWMDTDWGRLPVLGIPALVDLKKTQRIEDYPIISRLVLEHVRQVADSLDRVAYHRLVDWAMDHLFTLETLEAFLAEHPRDDRSYAGRWSEQIARIQHEFASPAGMSESLERELTDLVQRRIREWQAEDRAYWRAIVRELKRLRAENKLMIEGQPV